MRGSLQKAKNASSHLPPYRLPRPVQKELAASRSFAEVWTCSAQASSGSLKAGSASCRHSCEAGREVPPRQRRTGRVGLGSKVPVCCRICSVPSALGSGFPGLLLRLTGFGFRTLVGAGAGSWGLCEWVLVTLSLRGSSPAPAQENVVASLKPGWRCKAETQGIKHGNPRVDFSCKVAVRHYFWGLLMPS